MVSPLLLLPFLFATTPSTLPTTATRHDYGKYDAILIDVENVRGKSGFQLSHADVLRLMGEWTTCNHLFGKVVLVMDHGSHASSFYLNESRMAVVFSGHLCKADDVLVTDTVPFFSTSSIEEQQQQDSKSSDLCIVTADRELIRRCHRVVGGSRRKLHVIPPIRLLEDLERMTRVKRRASTATASSSSSSNPQTFLDFELRMGVELLEVESTLASSRMLVKNKRRKMLKLKAKQLQAKLSPSVLKLVSSILQHGPDSPDLLQLSDSDQCFFVERWEKIQNEPFARRMMERTGDRIILAEQTRKALLEKYGEFDPLANDSSLVATPALSYVRWRTDPKAAASSAAEISKSSLQLVVISDTHGFEEQLGDKLPDGDVLIHLGDFAIDEDGPAVIEQVAKFDRWLAQQSHRTKIVLRGNHDPRRAFFPESNAQYITRPCGLQVASFSFACVPYMGSGLSNKSLPKTCDVLLSHAPPKGYLDKAFTSQLVGSQVLLRGLERMKGGPPALLLCGHIHEGRGVVRNIFCGTQETLVINAANANSGLATRLEHGPVVIQLDPKGPSKRMLKASVIQMDGQYEFMNSHEKDFFAQDSNGLLMSVDLGLRTGICVFDDAGRLLHYDDFHFQSAEELEANARALIANLEEETKRPVLRIAIEGGDPPLHAAWQRAAKERRILNVLPDQWRKDLLKAEDIVSGEKSKAASRQLAREIVQQYGVFPLKDDEIQTDAAESILLGLHVSRRLGWTKQEPPIQRITMKEMELTASTTVQETVDQVAV